MKHTPPAQRLGRYVALTTLVWAMAAAAQADPTRPPAGWLKTQRVESPSSEATPAASANLISIILRGRERQIAVVDGQTVRPGDRLGAARVVQIETRRLVLNNGKNLDIQPPWPSATTTTSTSATSATSSHLTPASPNRKRP